MSRWFTLVFTLGTSWAALSCGGSGGDADAGAECGVSVPSVSDGPAPTPFLAFAQHFRGYHSWTSFDTSEDAALVGIHDGSKVTEYIKQARRAAAASFRSER
jgi:hypothetical protein